jgi:hypothetical protein
MSRCRSHMLGCIEAWALAAALTAAAVPRAVHAQTSDAATDADFDAGVRALREGRDEDAVSRLTTAYERSHQPVALLNLGIAYTRLGRVELAVQTLTQYVNEADAARDELNIQAVRGEIARLQALLPSAPPTAPPTAPTAATSAATATAEDAGPPEQEAHDGCSLGAVCLGPVLALGLPNLVGGGLLVRLGDYAALGAGFQMLPTVPILDLGSLSATLFTVEARIHPFGGVFFLSIGAAHQAVTAKAATAEISAEASAGMPALHLGVGFVGRDGAVLGIDIGLLLPLASTSVSVETVSAPATGVEAAVIADVERTAKRRAQDFVDLMPLLVQLNVLRLGLLF